MNTYDSNKNGVANVQQIFALFFGMPQWIKMTQKVIINNQRREKIQDFVF